MGGINITDDLSLHKRIFVKFEDSSEFESLTGLVFNNDWVNLGIRTSNKYGSGSISGPSFQITNLRMVSRVGPGNETINQIIFSIIQRAGVVVKDGKVTGHYQPEQEPTPENGFELYGGCTLIFDLDTLSLKYAIARPLLDSTPGNRGEKRIDNARAVNQYRYQNGADLLAMNEFSSYYGITLSNNANEPFALLHQH